MRLPRSGRVDRLARARSLADTLLNWTNCGPRFDGQRVTEIHCAVAADREVLLKGVRSARAVGQALQPQPLPVTGSDTSRMHGNGLPISIWRREIQSDWQHSAGGRQRLQPGRGGGSNGVLAVAEDPHKQGGHQARGAHSYRVAVSRRSYALDLAKGNTITQSIGASRILGVVRTIRGQAGSPPVKVRVVR